LHTGGKAEYQRWPWLRNFMMSNLQSSTLTPGWVAVKWLLYGWVTVSEQLSHLIIQPTPRSTQPSIPPA